MNYLLIFCFFVGKGFDGFLSYTAHSETSEGPRLCVCLARNIFAYGFHRAIAVDYSPTERMGDVYSTVDRLIQVFGPISTERWTEQACNVVQRNTARPAGFVAWLSRIPLRLSLWILWCDSSQLHSNEKFDFVGVPTQHASAWSIHAQSQSGHVTGNPSRSTCTDSFRSSMIQPPTLKKDLDSYLKTRGPVTFLSELRSVVQVHVSSINLHVRNNFSVSNTILFTNGADNT